MRNASKPLIFAAGILLLNGADVGVVFGGILDLFLLLCGSSGRGSSLSSGLGGSGLTGGGLLSCRLCGLRLRGCSLSGSGSRQHERDEKVLHSYGSLKSSGKQRSNPAWRPKLKAKHPDTTFEIKRWLGRNCRLARKRRQDNVLVSGL